MKSDFDLTQRELFAILALIGLLIRDKKGDLTAQAVELADNLIDELRGEREL